MASFRGTDPAAWMLNWELGSELGDLAFAEMHFEVNHQGGAIYRPFRDADAVVEPRLALIGGLEERHHQLATHSLLRRPDPNRAAGEIEEHFSAVIGWITPRAFATPDSLP